jgi:hypothetical protein
MLDVSNFIEKQIKKRLFYVLTYGSTIAYHDAVVSDFLWTPLYDDILPRE